MTTIFSQETVIVTAHNAMTSSKDDGKVDYTKTLTDGLELVLDLLVEFIS